MMATRMHRTQILLDPEQHRTLATIARREGRTISAVVREMIREQLHEREQTGEAELRRQLAALDRIRRQRDEMLARRSGQPIDVHVVDLIDELREERDERTLGGLADRRG